MEGYHLRNGTQSDKAWLYNLYCETMKSCIDTTWGWDAEFQAKGFGENLAPELWDIINKQSRDVGGFVLKEKGDHLWLEMMIIDPQYQKKGIGKSVITHIQSIAAARCLPLRLSVIKANPVKSFYMKLGFEQYSEDDSFYKLEWRS